MRVEHRTWEHTRHKVEQGLSHLCKHALFTALAAAADDAAAADAAAAAAVMYVFNKWLTYAWHKFAAD
jgi:hypothetical protein